MFTNTTGENLYSSEVCYVDVNTFISKTFSCRNCVYSNSVSIAWNGLVVSKHAYQVRANSIIFNNDFPLTIGDEIIIDYTIEGN